MRLDVPAPPPGATMEPPKTDLATLLADVKSALEYHEARLLAIETHFKQVLHVDL